MKNKIILAIGILVAAAILSTRFSEFTQTLNQSAAAVIEKDVKSMPTSIRKEPIHLRRGMKKRRFI